ncbi:Leucine-rich repeat protein kinase family protein, partial [Prunus dulcis]
FFFLLSRQHLHDVTVATTHLQTERHRFRWNHHTSFFLFQPTATSIRLCRRRKQPRNEAVLTVFQQSFGLSFSLISPPNLTSKHAAGWVP